MVIKSYNITLDDEEVTRAKRLYKKYGSKLSPLLNQLLKKWNDEEERTNE